ncbi:conjugal transfer protein [Enterococcus faecalis]|uniref:conjugal transfer protein n=1 Tax=Enterococcus faecalis TaxID=1351 RepID=UPI0018973973|nr:conjugal transfer protein [Enterococcus faecalis]
MKFIKEKKLTRPAKIEEEKTIRIKTVRKLFLLLIIFLVVSGPIGFIKASKMSVEMTKQQEVLSKEIQESLAMNQTHMNIPSELFKHFLEPFIEVYINIPTEQAAFEERLTTLQKIYYNFEIEDEKDHGVEQKLLSSSFYQVETIAGRRIATYKVSYESISPVTKEREIKTKEGDKEITKKEKYTDYETNETTVFLSIPFKEYKDGTFKINHYPYLSNKQVLTTEEKIEKRDEPTKYASLENTQDKEVTSFIEMFLDKYVSSTKEEMAYLMRDSEVLEGEYEIKTINTKNLLAGKKILVFATFEVIDKKTKGVHVEEMTLLLKQREGTYYVEQLTHFLGGIE